MSGNGTNAAQNNTFIDSSSNNFTITRTGNITQGSFSPYGSNWSNYFDGSSTYFTLGTNSAYNFSTGSWTYECWVNLSGGSTSSYYTLFSNGWPIQVYVRNNAFELYVGDSNASSGQIINAQTTSANSVPVGIWVHFALVRNSSNSTYKMYVNGVEQASTTSATNPAESTNNFAIGAFGPNLGSPTVIRFVGYVSNFRATASAVYTGTFTPSTTPLTAISGTGLLTCQSNRFIDNSTNNFAITVNNTPSVQRFSPFGISSAYSTSVIGGSAFFPSGTGDYLNTTTDLAAIGTNSFTVEGWWYPLVSGKQEFSLFSVGNVTTASGFAVATDNTSGLFVYAGDYYPTFSTTLGVMRLNAWNHIAVTRSTSTISLYVNGVLVQTGNWGNHTLAAGPIYIGRAANGYFGETNGYLSDIRYTNNIVYTTTFTPPTSPLTAISGTGFLANFTNGAIFDNAMMNDGLTVNNAQVSSTQAKFGTGSMKFVRASYSDGDFLSFPKSQNYDLSGGPFTIEAWVYPTLFDGQYQTIVSRTPTIWKFGFLDNQLVWYNGSANIVSTGTVAVNAWSHVAVTGDGTNVRIFINGVLDTTVTDANPQSGLGTLNVGAPANGEYGGRYVGEFYTGYIDDLRITKGFCRYTATFTPPVAAFATISAS